MGRMPAQPLHRQQYLLNACSLRFAGENTDRASPDNAVRIELVLALRRFDERHELSRIGVAARIGNKQSTMLFAETLVGITVDDAEDFRKIRMAAAGLQEKMRIDDDFVLRFCTQGGKFGL